MSELLILQSRTPDSAPAHVEVAELFREVGDEKNALKEYEEALKLDEHEAAALAGAGETSFQVASYGDAQQYLRAALEANPQSEKTRRLLTLTDLVRSEDPLAPGISTVERQKRLLAGMALSVQRIEGCLGQTSDTNAVVELQSLKTEAASLESDIEGQVISSRIPMLQGQRLGSCSGCNRPHPHTVERLSRKTRRCF